MRLGLVIYNSLESVSGGYRYDRELVQHLQRCGDKVQVFALPWRSYLRHLGDNLAASWWRTLLSAKIDLLLQDELNHPSLFWLNRRLRGRVSYPLVAIVHHLRSSERRPVWQNRLYAWVERRYLLGVDGFIFNSEATRQAVATLAPPSAAQLHVVAHPGRDPSLPPMEEAEVAQRCTQPGPLRLLFLGNVIPRKGLHTLLEACRCLPSEAVTLTVVGNLEMDRRYAAAIRRAVRRNGLVERVRLCGYLGETELREVVRYHQVLAVPSSYEGFGIVYLEGMAWGLPALATTAGGAAEVVTHGVNGLLLPPEDPQALAEVILSLHHDRRRLLTMSLAALERYRAHPTWEESAARIRAFLTSMVRPSAE